MSICVFGVWVAVLASLAAFGSNPVTLNRAQITAAAMILEGTVIADDRDQWQVTRSWPKDRVIDERAVRVEGLGRMQIEPGQPYLIPVERTDENNFTIVLAPPPIKAPPIYPANRQTISDLESILQHADDSD